MKFWLCITNQDNWEVVKEKNIWGASERHKGTIEKVRPGDKCLFYVISTRIDKEVIPSRIVAAYEVTSEPFKATLSIFKPASYGESYPLRINLKQIKMFKTYVEFKPIVTKLSFIKNKRQWSSHIRGRAMREIPKVDYELILNSGN